MVTSRTQNHKLSMATIANLVICDAEFDRKYTNGDRPVSADDPFFTALAQQSKSHLIGGELTRYMTAFLANVVRLFSQVKMKQLSPHKLQEALMAFRGWFIQNRQPYGEREWQHLLECCRKNPVRPLEHVVVAALYAPGSFMFNESMDALFRTPPRGSNIVARPQPQRAQRPSHAYTANAAAGAFVPVSASGHGVGAQQPYGPFPVYYGVPFTTINHYHTYYGASINQCYTQSFESRVVERLDNLATEVVKINKNLGIVQDTLGHVEDKVDTCNIIINGEY